MEGINVVICGLGYVGLPLAYNFSKKVKVYAYDIDSNKIESYKKGIDITGEIGNELLKKSKIEFSDDQTIISKGDYIIVTLPTPISENKTPDLSSIINISKTIGKYMKEGAIVIYESTFYPGVTENICRKEILKNCSNKSFKLGYSPERINPGDKTNTLLNTTKIISGDDKETQKKIKKLYSLIIKNIVTAKSIAIAEMTKIVENVQRDVNISFINEIAEICHKLNISVYDVLELAKTKWNFLDFTPGLVGGHCIGVDSYYLISKTKEINYNEKLISATRCVNENFENFIVDLLIKNMILNDIPIKDSKIKIYGLTFKENVKDIRNTGIIKIINKLKEYKIKIYVEDPYYSNTEVSQIVDIDGLSNNKEKYDVILYGVNHDKFKGKTQEICKCIKENGFVFDLKNVLEKNIFEANNIKYITL